MKPPRSRRPLWNRFLVGSFVLGLGLTTGLWTTGCLPSPDDTHTKLVITGSSTVAPLVSEIAKRYEAEHPGVRIDVQTGGSSRGIADARNGTAHLGMISRDLKDDEQDLQAATIARDGVGLIVHRDNPIDDLDADQVAAIYRGEIQNWSELAGPDGEIDGDITVVNKAEGRATLEVFKKFFGLESPEIEADVIIGHNEQGIKTVAGNAHSIGYVSIGVAESDIQAGVSIRLPSINGIKASTATVADGSFPVARPLNLVFPAKPQLAPDIRRFLDYCRSNTVHDLIQDQYFVPSLPVSSPDA